MNMSAHGTRVIWVFFVALAAHQALGTDSLDFQEKQMSQVKRRLTLQSTAAGARDDTSGPGLTPASGTAPHPHDPGPDTRETTKAQEERRRRRQPPETTEIQACLVSSGDVGCGTFQCFNNNSCEIQGLHHICLTLLHNAGRYDPQGKSYVKDALRCMALGLRQRVSCVSRRCTAVKDMIFSLQRECFSKHQLCLALQQHLDSMGSLVHFHLLFPPGPYVELMNFLLSCGEEARSWVGRRLQTQCTQHWGQLCDSFSSSCFQSGTNNTSTNTNTNTTTPTVSRPPPPTRAPPHPRNTASATDNQTEAASVLMNATLS